MSEKSVKRCPVCNGRGTVRKDFYNRDIGSSVTSDDRVQCQSCFGRGIIILD